MPIKTLTRNISHFRTAECGVPVMQIEGSAVLITITE